MLKLAYYVRRCKRRTGPERYKTLHCADTQKTFCGKFLNDGMWHIEENAGIGKLTTNDVTCKGCKRQIKKRKNLG